MLHLFSTPHAARCENRNPLIVPSKIPLAQQPEPEYHEKLQITVSPTFSVTCNRKHRLVQDHVCRDPIIVLQLGHAIVDSCENSHCKFPAVDEYGTASEPRRS